MANGMWGGKTLQFSWLLSAASFVHMLMIQQDGELNTLPRHIFDGVHSVRMAVCGWSEREFASCVDGFRPLEMRDDICCYWGIIIMTIIIEGHKISFSFSQLFFFCPIFRYFSNHNFWYVSLRVRFVWMYAVWVGVIIRENHEKQNKNQSNKFFLSFFTTLHHFHFHFHSHPSHQHHHIHFHDWIEVFGSMNMYLIRWMGWNGNSANGCLRFPSALDLPFSFTSR